MNCDKNSLLLYAVTDRAWLQPGETLLGRVRDAIEGGATFVQLREKDLDPAAFLVEGREIGALCREMGVPFVVDDDVDLALACGADGAHVGQSDLAAGEARKKLGPDKILGVSAQTVEQALAAERAGADYLGVGAVFSTSTKLDACEVPLETLSLEYIIAAEPDYIFAVLQGSDPTDAMETLEQTLLQNPAWSELRAVRDGRFYTLEHELYNLKPNARWGEAYEKLADILYPDAD